MTERARNHKEVYIWTIERETMKIASAPSTSIIMLQVSQPDLPYHNVLRSSRQYDRFFVVLCKKKN